MVSPHAMVIYKTLEFWPMLERAAIEDGGSESTRSVLSHSSKLAKYQYNEFILPQQGLKQHAVCKEKTEQESSRLNTKRQDWFVRKHQSSQVNELAHTVSTTYK